MYSFSSDINFADIQISANGMLPIAAYEEIYKCAISTVPGIFVEVGTAHGAATITMALAAKISGRKVYTFDKILGGSRERYGSLEDNIEIINSNFRKFGVEDCIELIIGHVKDNFDHIPTDQPIALLMIDADGAIDRDLSLFYERLSPGAIIIIDDYSDSVKLKWLNKRNIQVDLKHKLTYHLLNLYIEKGYVVQKNIIQETFFGEKPATGDVGTGLDKLDVLNQYRKIVFSQGTLPGRLKESVLVFITDHPRLRSVLRFIRDRIRSPK